MTDIRETVRERYAAAAQAATSGTQGSSCCGPSGGPTLVELTQDAEGFSARYERTS